MGQVQNRPLVEDAVRKEEEEEKESSSLSSNRGSQEPPSLEDLIEEATAFGGNESESIDVRAQKALECPCIADLRKGPCGTQFSEAFLCFMKSTAEEKGSDCVHPFVALQDCIKLNPNAFSKDVVDEVEDKPQAPDIKESSG